MEEQYFQLGQSFTCQFEGCCCHQGQQGTITGYDGLLNRWKVEGQCLCRLPSHFATLARIGRQ